MRMLVVAASVALLMMPPAAYSQNSTKPNSNASPAQGETPGSPDTQDQSAPNGAIGQRVKQELEHAGFTDVAIVPNSFVIRAKNQQGEPVIMLIDADAMTALELHPHDSDSTTGEAPSSPQPSSPQSTPSGPGERM